MKKIDEKFFTSVLKRLWRQNLDVKGLETRLEKQGFDSHVALRDYYLRTDILEGGVPQFLMEQAEARKAVLCKTHLWADKNDANMDRINANVKASNAKGRFLAPIKKRTPEGTIEARKESNRIFDIRKEEVSKGFDFSGLENGQQTIQKIIAEVLPEYSINKSLSNKYCTFFSKKMGDGVAIGLAIYPDLTHKKVFSESFEESDFKYLVAAKAIVYDEKEPPKHYKENLIGGLDFRFTELFDFGNTAAVLSPGSKEGLLFLIKQVIQAYALLKNDIEQAVEGALSEGD